MGLSPRDSNLQRVGGTSGVCDKEATVLSEALSQTSLSLVGSQRKEPPRNVIAEPLRFGALNIHSPSSFLVKSIQVEIS